MIESEGSLFVLLDELQQIHGLRTDDYVRYRRYCTRKLERLRSKFNLHQTSTSQVKVSLELCQKNSEALHLVLFKCEWFWAEINQLRNELSINSRKKHHLRSICLNSLKYIKELKNLSQETFEIGSNIRLEYLSYVNLLEGIVRNELKEFCVSFNCLQKSNIILQELIKRNFQVSLLETKISELETVMRVCQYSADMYEVLIEINENELNEFKINQLTEKLSESKIEEEIKEEGICFCSRVFKLSPEIKLVNSFSNNLKLARKIMKKQKQVHQTSSEYENARIQLAYFENRVYSKLVKKTLWKHYATEHKSENYCLNALKKLSKSTAVLNFDEDLSKCFDIVVRLLWNLSNIFGNKDKLDVSKNAFEALQLIKSIKAAHSHQNLRIFKAVLRVRKYLVIYLKSLIMKNAIYYVKGVAPVPSKPSFYDMAFDCLSYELDLSVKQSPNTSGFSNLLSGFWGKK